MKMEIERFKKEIERINEILRKYGTEIRDVSRFGVAINTTSKSPFSTNGFARLDFVVNEGVVELVIHTKSSEYTLEEIEDRLKELKEVYNELEECFCK